MYITVLNPQEWANVSENAHLTCFYEIRFAHMDRIDFTLVTAKEDVPQAYCTVRELDSETVYWQYGGAFPSSKNTVNSFASYKMFRDWCFNNGYERISTYVENTNIVMMKMAFKVGFRVIGTRAFKGAVLVELLNEKET